MFSLEDILNINLKQIENFGGFAGGFKDINLAISAIDGCNQVVFGSVLYPTDTSKLNHLVFSIVAGHVFVDGNKRTGSELVNLSLYSLGFKISSDDLISYIIGIASSRFSETESLFFLETHINKESSITLGMGRVDF